MKKLFIITFLIAGIMFFFSPAKVLAASICWTNGAGDNLWSTPTNWQGGVAPGTGDVATFDNTTCTGSPNANVTVDVDPNVLGISILNYTGTITQAAAMTIGTSGYTQSSSTSTFQGGAQDIDIALGGAFSQTNGTFISTSGSLKLHSDSTPKHGDFTSSGGTFNANGGTVALFYTGGATSTITGSVTFYNLTYSYQFDTNILSIASGTTITVSGTLSILDELLNGNTQSGFSDLFNGPGSINLTGNLRVTGSGAGGTALITVNGTGDQNIMGGTTAAPAAGALYLIPILTINKSSGTVNFINRVAISGDFTYTQGTINQYSGGTVMFYGALDNTITITGTTNLPSISFITQFGNQTFTIASGTTLTVKDFTLARIGGADVNNVVNGPGTINISGNVTGEGSIQGNVPITLTGSANVNLNSGGASFLTGNITINKPSGTVTLLTNSLTMSASGQDLIISSGTLNMAALNLSVDDVVTVNGGLIQGAGNVTLTNGSLTVGANGFWINNSIGDISVKGGQQIYNNGYIRWDGKGAATQVSPACGTVGDGIALTRSGAGVVTLNQSGTGRWRIYDITIGTTGTYAATTAMTIYSSSITGSQTNISNNNTCPSEITWTGGNGGTLNWNDTRNWGGDVAPTSTDLAVFDPTATHSASINFNATVLGVEMNNGFSYDIRQSGSSTFTTGSRGYEQLAGDFLGGTGAITVGSGGTFNLNAGTFTATSGTMTIDKTWSATGSATFTHNSGTVLFGTANSPTLTGSTTFYNLTFSTTAADTFTLPSGTAFTAAGTLTFTTDTTGHTCTINGPGTLTAQGNITLATYGCSGTAPLTVNGSGTQTITGDSNYPALPNITINKSSGILNFASQIRIAGNWTNTLGTLSFGSSTIRFDASTAAITGSTTFNALQFYSTASNTYTIANTTTLTATGTLTMNADTVGHSCTINVTGSGTLVAQGDIAASTKVCDGNVQITLSGTANQNVNTNDLGFPGGSSGLTTINKPSGTVTLLSAWKLNSTSQALTLTSGALDLAGFNLTVAGTFTVSNGATVRLKNDETVTNGSNSFASGSNVVYYGTSGPYSTLKLGYSYSNLSLSSSSSTTWNISGQSTLTVGSDLTVSASNTLTGPTTLSVSGNYTNAGTVTGSTTVTSTGNFTNSGAFTAPTTLNVGGNFANSGTFTHNSGSVVLNGTTQQITGSTTFNNLTKTVASAATLTFPAGSTQTVVGTLNLQGASNNLLSLRSSSRGTPWKIDPQATRTIAYLDVQDSNNINGTAINAVSANSIDSGGNTNWNFVTNVQKVNIQGGTTIRGGTRLGI